MEEWIKAQAGELQWHKDNPWRADDAAFMQDTKLLMYRFGFSPDDFSSVIDAGAGPRLRSRFFTSAEITAIEPLADEYMAAFDWCDLWDYKTYSQPIEIYIPKLKAEFLMSINVLDHCQDFDKAIKNISRYSNNIFLSFDIGDPTPDELHPLILSEDISEKTFKKYGLFVSDKTKTNPYRKGQAVNYWLRR